MERQRIIEKDRADKYSLFGDILHDPEAPPEMPEALFKFSRPATGVELDIEARRVFLVWLRVHLTQKQPYVDWEPRVPCADPGLRESFWPEWPDPDALGGEGSPEYLKLYAEADIDTAIAKRACSGCPLRIECLVRALDADVPALRERPEFGNAGGWGAGGLASIFNRLRKLQRAYVAGAAATAEGFTLDQRPEKAMSPETMRAMESQCFDVSS